MIGATISHYRIIKKLGQGGMGIVYQAQDTKLDRLVALKFLPHHLTDSPVEQARFMQEAKAASALNHPNVCIIHYIEEVENQQFIVMEYVDGVTLRDKFHENPLKLNDALMFAVQIGEALHEAHAKGIVHRDIKSDNIMVNSKNQIKVMDFGLAKLKGSLKLTRASSTVGTLSYMSPEQLQGDEADARSDIFSFGVVLYEMLTQHTPFRGEHEAAIVYSIVNENPEPVEKYRSDLPDDIARILRRAFEKDPEDRYQSVADMVSELRRLKKETSRVVKTVPQRPPTKPITAPVSVQTTAEEPPPAPAPPRKSKKWLTVALFVGAIGVIGYLLSPKLIPYARTWLQEKQVERVIPINPNATFHVVQSSFTEIGTPGISSDGHWIAFPAVGPDNTWDIYYMNVTGGEARRITSDSSWSMTEADISPDGGRVVYDRWNAKTQSAELCVVPVLGGTTTKIADGGSGARWRPDGRRIGFLIQPLGSGEHSGNLEFRTVDPDGRDQKLEFAEGSIPGAVPASFTWSPDGKSVALVKTYPSGYQEIFINELGSDNKRQLTFDERNIGDVYWSASDDILFSSERSGNANLWIMPAAGGTPAQVTKGSGPDIHAKLSGDRKVLLYLQQQRSGRAWVSDINGQGAHLLPLGERDVRSAALSPDGQRIAMRIFAADPLSPVSHIYLANLDGSGMRQVSGGTETVTEPQWSPDGKWIAYCSRVPTAPVESTRAYLIDPENPGQTQFIRTGIALRWHDESNIIVFDGARSWFVWVEENEMKQLYEDHTRAIPVLDGEYIFFRDYRKGREGWWIVSSAPAIQQDSVRRAFDSTFVTGPELPDDVIDSSAAPHPKVYREPKFVVGSGHQIALTRDGRSVYYAANGEIRKISLPGGREERLPATLRGRDVMISVGDDGSELVCIDSRLSSKLVVVENVF